MKKTKWIVWILILGLGLRLISINQSFWLDETTSGLVARGNLSGYFLNFSPGDFHPLVYYLSLYFWGKLWGTSEIALRFLSLLAAIINIYVLFLIGANIKNKKVGLLASLLLATSGLNIYFSQEARMYSLASLFVSLAVLFFVKTLGKESRGGDFVSFGLFLSLASLTHYLALLMVPVFFLLGWASKASKNWWKKFITSHNIIVLSWLVWLPYFYKQFMNGLGAKTGAPLWWNILGKTSLKEIFLVPIKFAIGRISVDNNFLYLVLVGVVFFLFFIPIRKTFSLKNRLAWSWLLIPTALAGLIGFFLPVFSYSRLLFVLPAFYLLVSIGLWQIKRKRSLILFLLLAVNIATSFVYLFNPRFHRENWKGLAEYIKQDLGDKNVVIFPSHSQMEGLKYYLPDKQLLGPEKINGNYEKIWLIRYVVEIFDPKDNARKSIETYNYKKIKELDFNGVGVWEYQKQ